MTAHPQSGRHSSTFSKRLEQKQAPLIGVALSSLDIPFVEIVSRIGMDVVWIEMEHAGITFSEAHVLCSVINGCGMLAMIRLPNADREAVLKAAETGADLLMAPMINDRETCQRLADHARYMPEGRRGFFSNSRAMQYGLDGSVEELRRQANERLTLWAQVETRQAFDCAEELCSVDGVDGLFMGPGDLSAELNIPGQIESPAVMTPMLQGLETCSRHGKLRGTVAYPHCLAAWLDKADLLIVGNNVSFYANWAKKLRGEIQTQMDLFQERVGSGNVALDGSVAGR